jgi:hypothetical protein
MVETVGQSTKGVTVWKMASVAEVDDVGAAARYIGSYLKTQSYRVHKYIMSGGWVLPDWIGFSQWSGKKLGVYPPREMLVTLAKMNKEENSCLGLHLWETKKNKKEVEISLSS